MIVLYILGGLLLLLVLVLLIPVKARLEFQEAFSLDLGFLWFRVPLLPGGEEEALPPREEEREEEGEEKEEKPETPGLGARLKAALKREGFQGFLQALGELIGLAGRAGAGVLKKLRLREFDLYLCLAGAENAAASAVLYGRLSAGVYSACGGLFALMPCRRKGVTVDLDYSAEESRVAFSAELSIRPLFVAKELLVFLFKSLRPVRKILKMIFYRERKPKHERKQGQRPAGNQHGKN